MGVDSKKVYVGLADQTPTTGALMRGPVISPSSIPSGFAAALAAIAGFTSSGYLHEDGASLATTKSVTPIKEWNRKTVRRVLEDFDGTLTTTIIQLDAEGAKMCFGEENVTVTPANGSHGEQIHVNIDATIDVPHAWALRMKDGDARFIVLIPNGQVTSGISITFAPNEPINLPIEISANDGGIQLYTDSDAEAADVVDLSALTVGTLALSPAFSADVTDYVATATSSSANVTAAPVDTSASIAIKNGSTTVANGASASLSVGENVITVTVTNGDATKVYTVTVNRTS